MKASSPKSNKGPMPARRVVILSTPNVQLLQLAGPMEVFSCAGEKLREAGRDILSGYETEVVSCTKDLTIRSTGGLGLTAHRSFHEVDYPIDTLLVSGGLDIWSGSDQPDLLGWLNQVAPATRRFGSFCTGAFVLAEAGLLNGRRVTTHWYFCQELQRRYPQVVVDPEPIFIRDHSLYTSAGVTAGIDMAVSMVEEDFGLDIALRVSRALVLFLRRPGGQSQFSTSLAFQAAKRIPLRELPVYVLEHLHEPLNVETLAARVSMSPRNFSRVFNEEFGVTPAAFIEKLRVETARRMVEDSARSFEDIAERCGLGSLDSLTRAFKRAYNLTPAQLRKSRSEARRIRQREPE